MPTIAQITAADDDLSAIAQAQILTLIRGSAVYRRQVDAYENLDATIADADTTQVKQINAALTVLDASGNTDGMVELSGGEEGVIFAQSDEREQLVAYILSVLYDTPPRPIVGSVSVTNSPQF